MYQDLWCSRRCRCSPICLRYCTFVVCFEEDGNAREGRPMLAVTGRRSLPRRQDRIRHDSECMSKETLSVKGKA